MPRRSSRSAGAERARALGAYTVTLSAAAVLGQVLGGALLTADIGGSAWRPLFLNNVPPGIGLFAAAARVLPRDDRAQPHDRLKIGGFSRLAATVLRAPLVDPRLFAVRGMALSLVASALTRITYFSLLFVIRAIGAALAIGRSANRQVPAPLSRS